MTGSQEKLRALFLSVLMVTSVFVGVAAIGGTAAAAANSTSVGNQPITPTSVNDNQSFQASIDYNVTGVNTTDGTSDGEITVEFDSEFDLSSASVSTVAVDSTGTDSNTTNVGTNLNASANRVNITFDDSGGMAGDTLRTELNVSGLQVSAGDNTGDIDTSVDADADGTFEIDSSNIGSITINADSTSPSVTEATADVTDSDVGVNVTVTDNRAVNESSIDVNATNDQTGETYSLVEGGDVVMGSESGAHNASDGSNNATEVVNLSVALPEGDYTFGVSASDINDNDLDQSGVGDDFSVDMAGDKLKVINDDSNPLAGNSASIDVVAVDKNGNELIFNDSNVGATGTNLQLSFDDPDNVTSITRPADNEVPINHTGGGYNVTFDVTYSEVGDLTVTAQDFGGNLTSGSATQTYTAAVKGISLTAADGSLVADGSDKETLTAQLVDQNGDPVPRSGESVSFGITSGNQGAAGVLVNSSSTTTNASGIATVTYNATSAGYTINVSTSTSVSGTTYTDTASFDTVAGDVNVANTVFRLNDQTSDVSGVKVNTTHDLSVEVLDDQSNPVANYPVAFTANGSEIATVNSDSDGFANTTVTLPTEKGLTVLNASAGPFNASATSDAQINVTSIAENASTLVYASDTRVVPANSSITVDVEVQDEFGNVNTTSRSVNLSTDDASVIDVGGSSSNTKTASNGAVSYTVNANSTSGSVTLTASADNVSDASDTFSINAPDAVELTFAPVSSITTSDDPDAYNGTVMYAQLVDSSDEALSINDTEISFGKVSGNSAVLQSTSAQTNESGVATVIINSTSNTGVSEFIAQSSTYNVQGRTTIQTVGAVDSLNITPNVTSAAVDESVGINITFRDTNDDIVPFKDDAGLSTTLGSFATDPVSLEPDQNGVVRAEAVLTAGQAGTANVTAIASNAGLADETSVEFTTNFGITNVSLTPSTVEGNQTVEHDLTFEVLDASDDGNTDTYTLTLPNSTSFADAGNATVNVTDANDTAVSIEGGPNVQDANGGTDNQLTFDIAPDSNNDTSTLTVDAAFEVSFPAVGNETTADVTIDVSDSARGDTSATTPVTITPSTADIAVFEVSDLSPMNVTVTQGDAINVSATVTNTGGVSGTQTVDFRVGGIELANQSVSLNASENTTVEFTDINTSSLSPGNYTHGVYTANASQTATLTVENATTGPSVPGVSGEVASAVAGDDGTIDRDDVLGSVQAFISQSDFRGASLTRSDILNIVQYFIQS